MHVCSHWGSCLRDSLVSAVNDVTGNMAGDIANAGFATAIILSPLAAITFGENLLTSSAMSVCSSVVDRCKSIFIQQKQQKKKLHSFTCRPQTLTWLTLFSPMLTSCSWPLTYKKNIVNKPWIHKRAYFRTAPTIIQGGPFWVPQENLLNIEGKYSHYLDYLRSCKGQLRFL